jgi:hypothetical protein
MIAPLQAKLVGVQIGEARDHRLEWGSVMRRVGHRSRLRLSDAVRMPGRGHYAAFRFGARAASWRFGNRTAAFDRASEAAGASVASGSFD